MSALDTVDLTTSATSVARPVLLRSFNEAGVLAAADVHVALRLARLARGGGREHVARGRAGRARAAAWIRLRRPGLDRRRGRHRPRRAGRPGGAAVAGSGGVGRRPRLQPARRRRRGVRGPAAPPRRHDALPRPLLARRAPRRRRPPRPQRSPSATSTAPCSADGLARLFDGEEPDLQRLAAATCVLRRLAVVGGGPGTGQDDHRHPHPRPPRRAGRSRRRAAAARRPRRADRKGSRAAPGGRARGGIGARPRRARASATARDDARRPCTGCSAGAREPQPLPARSPQPAAARRRRRGRDLDGVAVDDGAPAGGGAA